MKSIALTLCALALVANATRIEKQASLLQQPGKQLQRNPLMTYYLDATKPLIQLSTGGSGRQGRTALTVKLIRTSVSQFMPVVSPADAGMTHEVSNTWEALKAS